MLVRSALLAVSVLLFLAAAEEPPAQWVAVPGTSLHDLLVAQKGKMTGTAVIPGRDGRSDVMVTYVAVGLEYFRCFDFCGADGRANGFAMYKLIRPK